MWMWGLDLWVPRCSLRGEEGQMAGPIPRCVAGHEQSVRSRPMTRRSEAAFTCPAIQGA